MKALLKPTRQRSGHPCLSVRQPWVWAILRAGKRAENRDWLNSPGLLGQARALVGKTILLHACKGCTREEYQDAVDFMVDIEAVCGGRSYDADFAKPLPPRLNDLTRGAILARAKLAEVVATIHGGHRRAARTLGSSCLLCGARWTTERAACPKADPWAIPGTVGLILADVVALPEPVPYSGKLGFFDVPQELLRMYGAGGS